MVKRSTRTNVEDDWFIVLIPTRGRLHIQQTYDTLRQVPFLKDRLLLVVHPSEVEQHMDLGRDVLLRPDGPIQDVWEFMKNWAIEQGYQNLFIADDDLKFYRRASDEDYHLHQCNEDELTEMFTMFLDALDVGGWFHATLSARQFNNAFPSPSYELGRANAFHAFNLDGFKEVPVDMSATGLHDIHTTLSFIEAGYPNWVLTRFAWNQVRGSNAPGGCSLYRNAEWQHNEVMKLHALHPETTQVQYKEPKQGWGEGMKTRTDVRVMWQRAAKRAGLTVKPVKVKKK